MHAPDAVRRCPRLAHGGHLRHAFRFSPTDLPLPSRGAKASFYEATDCQAPEYRSTVETGSRRSGLLMSQGARGGGASNNPDVRRGERRPRALGAPGDETPDRSRAARHPVNPSPRRPSRVLTGGPLESSFTRRLPSLRGHRRDGDAPAASMRWTEWASRSIYHTVPSVETRKHDVSAASARRAGAVRASASWPSRSGGMWNTGSCRREPR